MTEHSDSKDKPKEAAFPADGSSSDRAMVTSHAPLIEEVVREAFDRNRELIVHDLKRRLGGMVAAEVTPGAAPQDDTGWQEIESMSRLRSLVGGRFQNLKERWTQAGFPLKEHRGDRGAEYKLNELGWLELSNWISQQGFEVRLRPDKADCLFEIRTKT